MKNENLESINLKEILEKKSVRTTFNISEDGMNSINWLIKNLSLKPKDLFNAIFRESQLNIGIFKNKDLTKLKGRKNIRKTYVISQQALRWLNNKANKTDLSRNQIVDTVVGIHKNAYEFILKKQRKKEKEAWTIIGDIYEQGKEAQKKLIDLLGEDDEIVEEFSWKIEALLTMET